MGYMDLSAAAWQQEYDKVSAEYESWKAKGLKLNMARGKPGKKQLELSNSLLTVLSNPADYALRKNAQFLVRGVRNSVDFDAEQQLSLIYRDVSEGALETVLLVAEPKYQHISSTMVREMIKYGQNLEKYMPLRAAALVKEWGEDHGEQ